MPRSVTTPIIKRQFSDKFTAAIREMIGYHTVDEFIAWARLYESDWGHHQVNDEGFYDPQGKQALFDWLETAEEEKVYWFLWDLRMEH